MFWKVVAVVSLIALPFSATLWRKSHRQPEQYRYDLTPYRSLRVMAKDGVMGLHLLTMPTKTALQSEFRTPLNINPLPSHRSLLIRSDTNGPFRRTWLIFPLWLSTCVLVTLMSIPLVRGPLRRWHRRWKGRCLECGYDLRGLRSRRCPECGMRFR